MQLQLSLAVTTAGDRGTRASLVASGEIDIASARQLHAAALAVVATANPRPEEPVTLVLDWEQVKFLDSSGVHLLQDIHAEGLERGWGLELILPSAPAPTRLLRFAADLGWFPRQLIPQLPAQSRPTSSDSSLITSVA
ncbi:STAS domain-containing protein [Sporichthya sp.]|uniref:STAS domain-containing protein n=1 Tax=Sporichthya sp. TaxID=65475 RepID=UPI0017BCD8B0|nr:STAS domain-containing protein [Sporichthya sp.]MBA3742557.1 STAS domain-containing protein [Sporichthya sp.]